MPHDPWFVLRSGAGASAFNMAVDEALLLRAPSLGQPVLRFYGWHERSATFGYFQHYAEIERAIPLRPLVRRPTGGGIVPHAADWTYSIAVPPTHAWYRLKAAQSYERVHRWLQLAFAALGLATDLAPCCRKEIPGQCFAGYEQFDLLRLGRKMAGAAQRRTKEGLLIQGSVQPPPTGLNRTDWEYAMLQAAAREWQIGWTDFPASPETDQLAQSLADGKYSRSEYNQRR